MQLRDFFIRLQLVQGMGLRGREYLWRFFRDQPEELISILNWSSLKIAEAAQITGQHRTRFLNNWASWQLTEAVNRVKTEPMITILDQQYPELLRQSYSPPFVLWYRGDLRLLKTPQLAVVGAREASRHAMQLIGQLLPPVCEKGITITSGLAKGVDQWSHQLALSRRAATVAIIGTGLNRAYPAANDYLQKEIGRDGLIISEYGLEAAPARHHFPERNRIIAGLAQAILVVEAKEHSGSLITANLALQNNREVLAIPGRPEDYLSRGTNQLLAAGARFVLNSEHIIEAFCLEI